MVMFDNIEDIFQTLRNFNDYSKALVTLATAAGTILILLYFVKFIAITYKGLRLYVWSQFCCKPNLRKRYGEWAVISGSTDGIGLAMAKEFARRGFSIIVIGRNEEKLSNTKLSLEEEPNVGQVITVKIDLADSSIENFERIRDQIDPDNRDIGILVNNAGLMPVKFARFNNFDMETSRNIANVNMLATVYLTRMIMPGMVDRCKGLVLNVSSLLGHIPSPYISIYGPTKAFMNSFSENLQNEYASHPIDIINLTPGGVQTKLFLESSKMKKSIFVPTADDYAKSAINAIATRYKTFSGTFLHETNLKGGQFFDCLGLVPTLFRLNLKLNAKSFKLSPVMKRRKVVQVDESSS